MKNASLILKADKALSLLTQQYKHEQHAGESCHQVKHEAEVSSDLLHRPAGAHQDRGQDEPEGHA